MICWLLAAAFAGPLPKETTQLLLVLAPDENSARGTLHRAVRAGDGWDLVGEPISARLGAGGLAWGVGLHPDQPGRQKVEGDLRSPAGLFLLGSAFRDDSVPPMSIRWPLQTVGPRDLWVEDPTSPHYNEHLVVAGTRPLLPWEQAARMRLGEPVLALKVFIAHNPPPAIPFAGSAIFLHGPADNDAPTAGCTAIAHSDLEAVIRWLNPDATPVFALLTREAFERVAAAWDLPKLQETAQGTVQ